jgi:hypothetical protein
VPIAVLAVVLAGASAPAHQPNRGRGPIVVPAGSQVELHVHNAGDLDRTCLRWFDGCVGCRRGADGSQWCNNIGFSCVPRDEVDCLERREDEERK